MCTAASLGAVHTVCSECFGEAQAVSSACQPWCSLHSLFSIQPALAQLGQSVLDGIYTLVQFMHSVLNSLVQLEKSVQHDSSQLWCSSGNLFGMVYTLRPALGSLSWMVRALQPALLRLQKSALNGSGMILTPQPALFQLVQSVLDACANCLACSGSLFSMDVHFSQFGKFVLKGRYTSEVCSEWYIHFGQLEKFGLQDTYTSLRNLVLKGITPQPCSVHLRKSVLNGAYTSVISGRACTLQSAREVCAEGLLPAREVCAEGPVHFGQLGKFMLKDCLSCTKAGTSWTKASWSVRTVKNRRVHTLWLAREVCPEGYIHFGQLATLVLNNLSKSVLHGYVHFSQLRKFVLKGTYTSAMFRPSQEPAQKFGAGVYVHFGFLGKFVLKATYTGQSVGQLTGSLFMALLTSASTAPKLPPPRLL
ncbi:hypothetical protein C8R45DRAFT_947768 [Mycena sanguinolenta]|nr:hypothetical protein C8R45DRAFT_947768 [Mycena sanguinolenta]